MISPSGSREPLQGQARPKALVSAVLIQDQAKRAASLVAETYVRLMQDLSSEAKPRGANRSTKVTGNFRTRPVS